MLRYAVVFFGLLVVIACPGELWAAPQAATEIDKQSFVASRYGEFLSWYKLLAIVLVWLVWVFFAARINHDLLKWSEDVGMLPENWNMLTVGCMFAGLLAVLFVPVFWIGAPIFALASFVPLFVYRTMRQSVVKGSATLSYRIAGKKQLKDSDFEKGSGTGVVFTPPGNADQRKKLQIAARQGAGYTFAENVLSNGLANRIDVIRLDYTRQGVGGRMQIDGVWSPMPPLDRENGDAMLNSIKMLAGMNPSERRQKQRGRIEVKWDDAKLKSVVDVISQGVPTGEQVIIKYQRSAAKPRNMVELGIPSANAARAKKLLDAPGLIVISAPAQGGLTTLWQSALLTADRVTRDFVAVISEDERDTDLENIQPNVIRKGEDPSEKLRQLLLTQPDVLVLPDLLNGQVADEMANQVTVEKRTVITRAVASTGAEALLRVFAQAGDRRSFASALTGVINQRLVRKLCTKCRVELPVKPEVIAKMGGDPKVQKTLFRHYQLPPVEQRVDEKGNPVEMTPCENCQGTGFYDRIAALEVIEVNDGIRKTLLSNPRVEAIEQSVKASGGRLLMQEAMELVLDGTTSMDEVRRVFSPPRK